jgi:hypothetical protein
MKERVFFYSVPSQDNMKLLFRDLSKKLDLLLY